MSYGVSVRQVEPERPQSLVGEVSEGDNVLSPKDTAYGNVLERLKQMIKEGELHQDELPPRDRLASSLGVPEAAVQRALQRLLREGVLTHKSSLADSSFLVEDITGFVSEFASTIANGRVLVQDVYQARLAVDPLLAELAASRATRVEIKALEKIVSNQMRALQNGKTGEEQDRAFNIGIAKAAGNGVLQDFSIHLVDQVSDLRCLMFQDQRWQLASLEAHRVVVKALLKRDGVAAYVAMRRYLADVSQWGLACE